MNTDFCFELAFVIRFQTKLDANCDAALEGKEGIRLALAGQRVLLLLLARK